MSTPQEMLDAPAFRRHILGRQLEMVKRHNRVERMRAEGLTWPAIAERLGFATVDGCRGSCLRAAARVKAMREKRT